MVPWLKVIGSTGTTTTREDIITQQTWTRSADNPVLPKGASGSWDEKGVEEAFGMYDSGSGTYKVLYRGADSTDVMAIGLAETSDLTTGPYSKSASNPVFAAADSAFATSGIRAPEIFDDRTDAGEVKVYYSGWSGSAFEGIGLATSTDADLTTLTDQGKLIGTADLNFSATEVGQVGVTKIGTTYVMVFWANTSSGQRLGLAYSSDGTTWTMDSNNPVLTPADIPGTQSGAALGTPHLFTVNDDVGSDKVFMSTEAPNGSGKWHGYLAYTTRDDLTDGSNSSTWTAYEFGEVFLDGTTSIAWEDSGNVAEMITHTFDDGTGQSFAFYEGWTSTASETQSETGVCYSSLRQHPANTLVQTSVIDWDDSTVVSGSVSAQSNGDLQLAPPSTTDDFSDGTLSDWTVHHGTFDESGGVLSVTGVDSNEPQSAITQDNTNTTDGTTAADITYDSGATSGYSGVMCRYQRPSGAFYFGGIDVANDELGLYYNDGTTSGSFTVIQTAVQTIDAGTTYRLELTASGTSLDLVLKDSAGTQLNSVSGTDSTLSSSGYSGMRGSEANVSFDNFDGAGTASGDATLRSPWFQAAHFGTSSLSTVDLANESVSLVSGTTPTLEFRSAPDDGTGSPDTANASAWSDNPTNVPTNEWVQGRVVATSDGTISEWSVENVA